MRWWWWWQLDDDDELHLRDATREVVEQRLRGLESRSLEVIQQWLCSIWALCLPGLHPWGLAGGLVAGPGLFPARLRRSSAWACAAAAEWRSKMQFTHRTAHLTNHIKYCRITTPLISFNKSIASDFFFPLQRNASSGSWATEQSGYWRHHTPLTVSTIVSPTRLSVTGWEERAAGDNIRTFVCFLVHSHDCEVA